MIAPPPHKSNISVNSSMTELLTSTDTGSTLKPFVALHLNWSYFTFNFAVLQTARQILILTEKLMICKKISLRKKDFNIFFSPTSGHQQRKKRQ